jgi:hypothetical protein
MNDSENANEKPNNDILRFIADLLILFDMFLNYAYKAYYHAAKNI